IEHGFTDNELWKSDGTAAGTVLVKDITPGVIVTSIPELVGSNGMLFFVASGPVPGQMFGDSELWKSDGTEAGTTMVKNINPGGGPFPTNRTAVDGTLFFRANGGATGTEVWKSDGTEAGTLLVRDIVPGTGTSFPKQFTKVGSTVFFSADTGTHPFAVYEEL